MGARWYKRCGADFIHGTMMLTLEEKGAYSLCLDLIYDRGGPIPDDARWLSGVCGVSLRKWASIRARLIDLGKIASDGAYISNSRAVLELVSVELHARKLAESGAKGGRKRAENLVTANEISDLAEAPLKLTREDKIREEDTPIGVLRARGSRLPEDWEPKPLTGKALAMVSPWQAGEVERELAKFRNYWLAKSGASATSTNWQRNWVNWLINADERKPRNGRQSGTSKIRGTLDQLFPADQREGSEVGIAGLPDPGRTAQPWH